MMDANKTNFLSNIWYTYESELILDVDDLNCIYQQLISISNGWGMSFTYSEYCEADSFYAGLVYNWEDKSG